MKISDTIFYVGVNDHEIDRFEGQYAAPNGMAYNSYVIVDEKIAVMDSVEPRFAELWLRQIEEVLQGRRPDYLVVQHMEPDHSGSILRFLAAYPEAKIVASEKAFTMLEKFYGTNCADRRIVVGEKDRLPLGSRTLTFLLAPMIHWPEVIMTYDDGDKVLFSADAFGKFGALDVEEGWVDEARRYYIGIVGKFGVTVQNVLKKISALDVQMICSLHGPVLKENLGYYVGLYDTWSRYAPEEEGIVIAYTSIYGHTKEAVDQLAELLRSKGGAKVTVYDLARCDVAEAVAAAFRYSKLVLATTTYNGGVFPYMREFIDHLTSRAFKNRTVALIENGSWIPQAAKGMEKMLETSKDLHYLNTRVTIDSALNDKSRAQLEALAAELCPEIGEGMKKYVCKVSGYVHEAADMPADFVCPHTRCGAKNFEELK